MRHVPHTSPVRPSSVVAKGKTTLASEVHHRRRCFDDPELQVSWQNLEALCSSCHDEITASERRGYRKDMDHAGYFTDPNHPTNRARPRLCFGTDATKLKRQP